MIPVPRIPQVEPNQKLGFGLVNHIIKRTEYAAELLRQYKCVAGDDMFVEPHPDGTRISYLQKTGGGVPVNPAQIFVTPPADLPIPVNPPLLECSGTTPWSFSFNLPVSQSPQSGYVVGQAIWSESCLASLSPKVSFTVIADDAGTFAGVVLNSVPGPFQPPAITTGVAVPKLSRFGGGTFFMWAEWMIYDIWGGGFSGSGSGNFYLGQ